MHYLYEALIVGIATVLVGYPITYLIMYLRDPKFQFNYKLLLILNFFVVGFGVHVISELTGMNKLYCKSGYACRKK